MSGLRVLVVDDSVTVRKRLREILEADPDIGAVGEAADGREAIELCLRLRPDVITMDMAMPVMSGLAATEYIMAHQPTPILLISSSTNRGDLLHTYDALAAGAVDAFDKPSGAPSDDSWSRHFVGTVKLVARIPVVTRGWRTGASAVRAAQEAVRAGVAVPRRPEGSRADRPRLRVAALGASTGGPAALATVLHGLPRTFTVPVLVVLHIGPPFAQALTDWLDAQSWRDARYARAGEAVADAAGQVLVAPPDQHLRVYEGRVRLDSGSERNGCRPSVDVLFESLADDYGAAAAGCLLTGMGRDGAAGLLRLRTAGGLTIAQDEQTSVLYGMPREARLLGAAEHVLPLDQIGPALAAAAADRAARHGGAIRTGQPGGGHEGY